jgi:hypothetical protein
MPAAWDNMFIQHITADMRLSIEKCGEMACLGNLGPIVTDAPKMLTRPKSSAAAGP